MELRVLGYFLAVAREENFTRAAEQLHVTQPTLSRQIADLEAELGVKLFTRSNHNIILTEDGMLLKRRAQEILSLADKTKRDFYYKEENLEGTITIGSGEFLSTGILTDCIAAFRKKYPLVRYELYSGLRFIPFAPALESTTAFAWKKEQIFSSAASAFIESKEVRSEEL